mmetsp:Transcript_16399/g.57317  ORF Transcript_16399/g.57317 Transcript_16399/m.57317 type:complete len:209 (-) Transcript_16399:202-828(-)
MPGTAEDQKPIERSCPQWGSSTYFCTSSLLLFNHSHPVTGPVCCSTARILAWNLSKLSFAGTEEMPWSPCTRCSVPNSARNAGASRPMMRAGGALSTKPSMGGGCAEAPAAYAHMQRRATTVPKECPSSRIGASGRAALEARMSSARSATIRGRAPSLPQAMQPKPGEPSASEVRPCPRASWATTARPTATALSAKRAYRRECSPRPW